MEHGQVESVAVGAWLPHHLDLVAGAGLAHGPSLGASVSFLGPAEGGGRVVRRAAVAGGVAAQVSGGAVVHGTRAGLVAVTVRRR